MADATRWSLAAALASALSCAGEGPCPAPDHCLRAEHLQGACRCTAWETAWVEDVAVPYVVAAVAYPPAGNSSSVRYGGLWTDPAGATVPVSPIGSRLRARVRTAGGTEISAPATVAAGTGGTWELGPVTAATVALTAAHRTIALSASRDLPTHATEDWLAVWVNPRVTVSADWGGGRTVAWSGSPAFPECGPEPVRVAWLHPAHLQGSAVPQEPCGRAFVDSLDSRQRAEILAHDQFVSPPGGDPQAFFGTPRFQTIENTSVYFQILRWGTISWQCLAPLADDDDPGLYRSLVPMASGDTLAIEHAVLATDPTCPVRTLGFVEGTGSDGCQIATALVLDQASGTALMVAGTEWPWSGTLACTR
jgi:hypothetical protein